MFYAGGKNSTGKFGLNIKSIILVDFLLMGKRFFKNCRFWSFLDIFSPGIIHECEPG
jgi:hypothetical protein